VLNIEPDLPLGVRPESPRRKTTAPLSPGQVILLYTDGLIERRGTPLTDSLELLRGVVVAGPAETVCVRVMSAMIGGEAAVDDVAVLAISRTAAG
jgi:serine phosphatase RsbU (regulator of sigma subunit)